MVPVILTQQESTWLPAGAITGFGSPVTAEESVQGDTVAGADKKNVSYPGLFRRNGFHFITGETLHHFRTKIYGVHNLFPALSAGQILEIFTDAVEEHDTHRFRVLLNAEGA